MFTVKGVEIDVETLDLCRAKGIACVVFYPDVAFNHAGVSERQIEKFDLIATAKSYHVDYMATNFAGSRIHFLPHGYSDLVQRDHAPARESDYLWDVAYVGNASAHKFDYLRTLRERLPEIRMIVAGSGWERFAADTPLAQDVVGYGITGDHLAAISARSRVNVAVHFGVTNRLGWEDLVSRRSFEIPAYGGFLLHVDNPEIRDLYAVPDEIDVFGSPDELAAKTGYYLQRPDQRAAMIAKAHARAVPAYGYIARAAQLDRLVRGALANAAA